jgi:hypothetical protein
MAGAKHRLACLTCMISLDFAWFHSVLPDFARSTHIDFSLHLILKRRTSYPSYQENKRKQEAFTNAGGIHALLIINMQIIKHHNYSYKN